MSKPGRLKKSDVMLVIFGILLAGAYCYFYSQFVIVDFRIFDKRLRDVEPGAISVDLPEKAPYLIIVQSKGALKHLAVNGAPLIHTVYRARASKREWYFFVPPDIVLPGVNELLLGADSTCFVKIKNTLGESSFGLMLFKESPILRSHTTPLQCGLFFIYVMVCALFLRKFLAVFFALTPVNHAWLYILSYAPVLAFFAASSALSRLLPLQFVLFQKSFIGLCCLTPVLTQIIFFGGLSFFSSMTKDGTRTRQPIDNAGSAAWWTKQKFADKCVVGFMVLLAMCAFSVIFNISFLSEFLANISFVLLVVAVVIKFRSSCREE